MQSDCPAAFLATGHKSAYACGITDLILLASVAERHACAPAERGTAMSTSEHHHSDYEPAQLVLFGMASVVILLFAWAAIAY
jgi:hypothetical protein